MKHKGFEFNGASRSNQRAKRRKTNLILNSLIVVVLLLIMIVSFTIFFGNGKESSSSESNQNIETNNNKEETTLNNEDEETNNSDDEAQAEDTSNSGTDSNSTDIDSETENDETNIEEDVNATEPDSEDVVEVGGSADPNVKTTITNPNWQPVGTVQSGEHASVYDENSTDWQEMLRALSYGTGLDSSNMTVWFLGRNKEGGDNQSVATVSSKDNSVTYRVFIEWVNGQGWKPFKVEELHENDRR